MPYIKTHRALCVTYEFDNVVTILNVIKDLFTNIEKFKISNKIVQIKTKLQYNII